MYLSKHTECTPPRKKSNIEDVTGWFVSVVTKHNKCATQTEDTSSMDN